MSPTTVNREITCLKHIFNKAKEWDKIESNLISSVKLFEAQDKRIRYLEKEEIARLIDACPDYIKFRNRIIYVLETKNNEVREIPIGEITFKTIAKSEKKSQQCLCVLQEKVILIRILELDFM